MSGELRYLSVCSGIEAASVAWAPLAFAPVAFAEVEPFPSAVLAHHYGSNLPADPWTHNAPPNLGDIRKFEAWPDAVVDVLVGGTPCQSFSVAGLRAGLADPRGNLCLTYLAIAARYCPRWILWENVPGVLSSGRGRDFGAFLGGLVELGYGFAYRVLDAQYVRMDGFGRAVPQRRRRVFVVGYLGDWRRAAAVLFDAASLRGDSAPSRQAREGVARPLASSSPRGSGYRNDADTAENLVARSLNAHPSRIDGESETFVACSVADSLTVGANQTTGFFGEAVAHSLRGGGYDASEDGTGRGTPLIAFPERMSATQYASSVNLSPSLGSANPTAVAYNNTGQGWWNESKVSSGLRDMSAGSGSAEATVVAQAFDMRGRDGGSQLEGPHETANIRAADGGSSRSYVAQQWAVRRLTPLECERLQGFPDGYTAIPRGNKPAADGPRYKALGNSMAVNVMRWLGWRISLVEAAA